jgi:hypothetical protein
MEPVRTQSTPVAVIMIGASLAASIAGCTSSKPSPQPGPAVIRVHVRLVYSHPAGPTMTSYNGPMRGEQVQASGGSGAGAMGTTGPSGVAVLRIPAGTYVVRAHDPCGAPSTVSPTAGATAYVGITCVAP